MEADYIKFEVSEDMVSSRECNTSIGIKHLPIVKLAYKAGFIPDGVYWTCDIDHQSTEKMVFGISLKSGHARIKKLNPQERHKTIQLVKVFEKCQTVKYEIVGQEYEQA